MSLKKSAFFESQTSHLQNVSLVAAADASAIASSLLYLGDMTDPAVKDFPLQNIEKIYRMHGEVMLAMKKFMELKGVCEKHTASVEEKARAADPNTHLLDATAAMLQTAMANVVDKISAMGIADPKSAGSIALSAAAKKIEEIRGANDFIQHWKSPETGRIQELTEKLQASLEDFTPPRALGGR